MIYVNTGIHAPKLKSTGEVELDYILQEIHELNYSTKEAQSDYQLAAALTTRHGLTINYAVAYVMLYREQQMVN